jgi:hypothetical protein
VQSAGSVVRLLCGAGIGDALALYSASIYVGHHISFIEDDGHNSNTMGEIEELLGC